MRLEMRVPKTGERGFSLTELMIAMMVFTVVVGSVIALLAKSQTIFRTEQGVSEMDQNARLLIDFITRDIQQAKENGLGLGPKFRSIYSYNGPEGKTDEIIIVSSDTDTEIEPAGLPLVPAIATEFTTGLRFIEALPNGAGHLEAHEVASRIKPNEELIISSVTQNGSVQFDFIRVKSVRVTHKGTIGIDFDPVEHRGVEPEIPFGSVYEGGAFSMRPVAIKRYFIDRKTDRELPSLTLSVNDSAPIIISRNVVAFQLRYLEQKEGEIDGVWVKQQNISREYRTLAVEVTMTARTEISGDPEAERLVTLASVIRPRFVADGDFGSSGGGGSSPGLPGGGGAGGAGGSFPGGGGPGESGFGGGGRGGAGGPGLGSGSGGGVDSGGFGGAGYNHETRRIGRQPKLGQRLNER
jgi:prepilin-type N-terminal cleavage/methylation domain-containing protein